MCLYTVGSTACAVHSLRLQRWRFVEVVLIVSMSNALIFFSPLLVPCRHATALRTTQSSSMGWASHAVNRRVIATTDSATAGRIGCTATAATVHVFARRPDPPVPSAVPFGDKNLDRFRNNLTEYQARHGVGSQCKPLHAVAQHAP